MTFIIATAAEVQKRVTVLIQNPCALCIKPYLQITQVCQVEDSLSCDLAKDGVLPVQLLCCIQGDEELAAVAVRDNCISSRLTSTGQQPSAGIFNVTEHSGW